ncbi:MAG: restriction endonuclease subunit S [Geobacteraceae bacterium]|nr:restriction endonuclease subunit S [Geobacteraceae bacterium]
MSEFEELQVGDHISLLSGFPFNSKYFDQQEGIRLIRIRDLLDPAEETYYRGSFDQRWLVRTHDILIGMDGDFNIVRWKGGDALLNQRILKVDAMPNGSIDKGFFYFWCSPLLQHIQNRTAATTVKHLSVKDIEKATGLFPEKSVQRRIAEILSMLDETIEQAEALIAKMQQVKAGLMHDLFTRGVTPDGRLRPTHAQAQDLYKESPLGWIPKEWKVKLLGELAEIVSGVTLGSKTEIVDGVGVPYLRVANVQDGYFDLNEVKTVRVSQSQFEKLQLRHGDVLMNEGGDFDKLGRGSVWQEEIKPCVHQNHVFRVRPRNGQLRSFYLAFWSQSEAGKKYFVLSSKQSTNLASINSTQLNRFPVAVPTLNEQELIEERLFAMNGHVDLIGQELVKLRQQKQGLMQDLLTGRVYTKPRQQSQVN